MTGSDKNCTDDEKRWTMKIKWIEEMISLVKEHKRRRH
jgi:hypothetical protein